MTQGWGGAQWILATVLALGFIIPIGRRYSPARQYDSDAQFWGEYFGRAIIVALLVTVLALGGFW